MNTPYSINTYVQAYNNEVLLIVQKLPDLVTNIGSFLFVQESGADNPNTNVADKVAPFENAVRDIIKALLDKIAQINTYTSTLQYANTVIENAGSVHPYNTTLFPVLEQILLYFTSVKTDLTNILTQIDTFNTSTFGAFAIINSNPYKQVATYLPTNYSLNFITTTQQFLASNKTIDVYTNDLYKNSIPAASINTFVSGAAAKVLNIKNHALPNQVALDAATTTYLSTLPGEGGGG